MVMQWSRATKCFITVFFVIAVILTSLGFFIDKSAGVLILCAVILFGGVFGAYLYDYNRKIRRMTEEIDKVLYNVDHIYIGDADEGELSILQSEIMKMTQRIRDQNDSLKREKAYLADSLADIAHQLRTPLTSVNMVLSFLNTDANRDERMELLREADGLLRRMDYLLTALLKLSRLDAGVIELKFEKVSLQSLVHNALLPLEIPMELLNVTVHSSIPQNVVVTADQIWFTEALQNILKNGMESAGENGVIEISCEDTLLYTIVTIHDNGKGFQNEDIPHLFERFYRGKNSKANGFGIGLALSKIIIDRHGGLLTAENHPAGGALFTIKFYK